MKSALAILAALTPALPALAHELDSDTVVRIEAKLADMRCQMDPADITHEGDGYDLDDVICEGGQQFDIKLDNDLNEVSRRAE